MSAEPQEKRRVADTTQRKHYIPDDGHDHVRSADCWCRPEAVDQEQLFYVHNPWEQGHALLQ